MHQYILAALEGGAFPVGVHPEARVHPSAVIEGQQVHIGAGAVVMPQATLEGPAIIGAGALVGQAAYVRTDVILSRGAGLGHASEAKNALFLEGAHAPISLTSEIASWGHG
ncbi:MAG: hypothetical protein HC915_00035 [Anaerolineae bacterium]|nr:hypothetical protein [Anaerolineae bacterium]